MALLEPLPADAADAEDGGSEIRSWVVPPDEHGLRLDKALVLHAGEFSRNHLQQLIGRGCVRIGPEVCDTASRKLRLGQTVSVELQPTQASTAFRAEPMALDIVYEDEHLMVLRKPAGLVVHPAAGHWSGTLLNGLLAHDASAAALPRAGIVHRLDKDTSGLMVVARSLVAMTALVRAIAAREVSRVYLALAHGEPAWGERLIDAPVGRDPVQRIRMAVHPGGKPAQTTVEVLHHAGGVSALRCTLHTGRTHQIRVHLSHLGHPLVGDMLYGGRPALGLERQALHAQHLSLQHPVSGEPLSFQAELPPDLLRAWQAVAPISG